MRTNRREFLRLAAAGAASTVALRSAGSDSLIEILVDEPIATIAPEIYSHFTENLGGVVYDGIWVGEESAVPNVGGLRKQLIESLRRIGPPAIRWPGGCFADSYDWHDGIGPRAHRPKRTNFWVDTQEWPKNASRTGPQSYDPNQFGTVEFARFCRLTGAEPYLAANLRGLRAQDFDRWIEYCNAPAGTTTLAGERAAGGERDPLKVRYWGVGNEAWGCGGNFTPEDYATEFLRFTAWTPEYGVPLSFVGSGPNDNDLEWTRKFFAKVGHAGSLGRMWGWSMHHYAWNASAGRTTDWFKGKTGALDFDSGQYYEVLHEADLMDLFITSQWNVMGEADPRHHVKLVVDEWGAWYAPGTEPFAEALLGQQSTMLDAVLAGLTLDTFNRHADKVGMACVAQLVNCLQSLFFAHEDKFCLTPTYHVFDMYQPHKGGQALRTLVSAPSVSYSRNVGTGTLPGLSCSASRLEKRLTITVTNPSLDQTREADLGVRNANVLSANTVTLAAPEVHAHNTFDNPHAVEPRRAEILAAGSRSTHRFPPASVTRIELVLA